MVVFCTPLPYGKTRENSRSSRNHYDLLPSIFWSPMKQQVRQLEETNFLLQKEHLLPVLVDSREVSYGTKQDGARSEIAHGRGTLT